jgi:magnesium-protoporphyrin O-methyltransferase
MTCCHADGIEHKFDHANANKQLRRLRRRGPSKNTRLLIESLADSVAGASLIDIGGGVGTIHHLLLDAGAKSAVHVDISNAYLDVAREEAARRGHAGQVRFIHGDFVEVARDVPAADVVALDRVICCYPDMDALLGRAAEKTRRLLGAVYPRDAWWVRAALVWINTLQRLRRSSFRLYFHAPAAIDARLRGEGLTQTSLRRTAFWEIVRYERAEPNA